MDGRYATRRHDPTKLRNYFASEILGLSKGRFHTKFPALESLVLDDVPFAEAELEISFTFNLCKLRSLSLSRCRQTTKFLRKITALGQSIRLTKLSIWLIFLPVIMAMTMCSH